MLVTQQQDSVCRIVSRSASSMLAVQPPARHVCIRVPKPGDRRRVEYERCQSREAWVMHCLGEEGVYVGRPKNDGGWHGSPTVKAGSLFANPFSVKDYSLEESLVRFTAYLQARLHCSATTESIIALLPPKLSKLAQSRFAKGTERDAVGRSVAHLQLGVVGDVFRAKMTALAGKHLGCFCDEDELCHAKLLAEAAKGEHQHCYCHTSRAAKRQNAHRPAEERAAKSTQVPSKRQRIGGAACRAEIQLLRFAALADPDLRCGSEV
mmetsp:Transcript_158200/g.507464  ORF Transcript_158200/g.507464 Transcript_158200/m.507464 type:complete len:265 (-) Transcript_158200:231-1025(-)